MWISSHVAKNRRKADITKAKETLDPIIISQCRSDETSVCCCLVPDDFIFLDKARRITICFFNRHTRKATYRPIVVYIRNYKCKSNQWMSDSYCQVMRNPASQQSSDSFGALLNFQCQHSPVTLSKCSGVGDIWGTDLNISHLRCKWIGPPGLQSCQQLTLYECFIHQHIFPCEQQLLKKSRRGLEQKFFFFLKSFFWRAEYPCGIVGHLWD